MKSWFQSLSLTFSFSDNNCLFNFPLICKSHFSSLVTMRCKDERSAFLVIRLLQLVKHYVWFSSSCGPPSLQNFPIKIWNALSTTRCQIEKMVVCRASAYCLELLDRVGVVWGSWAVLCSPRYLFNICFFLPTFIHLTN